MKKVQKQITRPLSPHLTIYKPQISSVLSIGHRLSGIGLYIMLMAIGWGFICWVFSDFDTKYFDLFDNVIIKALMVITSYGYFYHFCTGIRHLFWDIGMGFEIKQVNITGYLAVLASFALTAGFWYLIWV